jgi:hypothetical protein
MKKAYFILILFCFQGLYLAAQSKVKIIGDPLLDSLVAKNIEINKGQPTIDGYRVQLFSSSERNNANALRKKFKQEYPEESIYLIYQQPYFKVRVGDYRTHIEAQQMYLKYQKTYGQILIIPDKINLPKL